MEELMSKWLSLFGSSTTFLLRENDKAQHSIDFSVSYDLNNAATINRDAWYGLFFTPNGNLGKVNVAGEKVKRSGSDCEKYIAAVYVDIDYKMYPGGYDSSKRAEYDKKFKKELDENQFNCQYAMRSGGGRHLYQFIKDEDRYSLGEALTSQDFTLLQNKLSEAFTGGDASSHSLNKLMRMPFSLHKKTFNPTECELYKITKEDGKHIFTKVTKPEEITLEGCSLVGADAVIKYVESLKPEKISTKKGTAVASENTAVAINRLNICTILEKLSKYPRIEEGRQVVYRTDGNRIRFIVDGQSVLTGGYKVNKEKNYVNNFSINHPDRPKGPAFNFLYKYFYKDLAKMSEFLEKEFEINFLSGGRETFLQLPTDNGIILFQEEGVYYRTTKIKGKATEDANEKLFDSPFIVKGYFNSKLDKKGEGDNKICYYIITLLDADDGEADLIMPEYNMKSEFNKEYQRKGLTFMKSDAYLVDFFTGLKRARKKKLIMEYDFYYLNGYYPNMFVEGDRYYKADGSVTKTSDSELLAIFNTQSIEHINNKKEITMSEYGEKVRNVFVHREAMICFTAFIALVMGHKFWNELLDGEEQQIITPGLILAGKTKAGKSTMVNLLLNGFGLSSLAKKKSVRGTTPQPLKQMATDDFIMHREEFTGDIGQEKENLIRDVLNKTKTGRGLLDGSNVEYIYRSALILDGERLPESESVVNRCVTVPFTQKGRTGTQKMLRDFEGLSYKKDFITSLFSIDTGSVKKDFRDAQNMLLENGLQDRYAQIYAFLICVNRWFNIYFENELLEQIKLVLDEHDEIEKSMTPLAGVLNDLVLQVRATPPTFTMDGDDYYITVPVPTNYKAQHEIDLQEILQRYGRKRARMSNGYLLITILSQTKDNSPERNELYDIFAIYRPSIKKLYFTELNGSDKEC